MQYSLVIIHRSLAGQIDFAENLDLSEVKEIIAKFYDAEFVVYEADAALDLKNIIDELSDKEREQQPSWLKDLGNETSHGPAGPPT